MPNVQGSCPLTQGASVGMSDNTVRNTDYMLLAESHPNHHDRAPEAAGFLKELPVPGSTK